MSERKQRKINRRIAGIGTAAAALGVTRQHLSYVLHGRRESASLLRRYAEWKGGE